MKRVSDDVPESPKKQKHNGEVDHAGPDGQVKSVDEKKKDLTGWATWDWLAHPESPIYKRVTGFYKANHSKQTVEFVKKQHETWCKLNHRQLSIWEVMEMTEHIVDESDPDIGLPQIFHAYQTAEMLKQRHPDKEWLQVVGFIHDVGKILCTFGEEQWAVTGDTFPVGMAFQHTMEYPAYWELNPDSKDSRYNSPLGVYAEHCGLEQVVMSWGHDEYLYRVLKGNKGVKIPDDGLYMIRYHSFWAWHYGGGYEQILSERDRKMSPLLEDFRKSDLYSKDDKPMDVSRLRPHYEALLAKYLPEKLWF